MPDPNPKLQALLDAVRPVARYAKNYRHHDYPVDARVPSPLLIALAEALAAYDEAEDQGKGKGGARGGR